MLRKYSVIFGLLLLLLPVVLAADPGQQSTLFLQSGNLNGQSISASSRTITVTPGQSISGSITVSHNSAWPTNINIPFGWTPSWGNHQTSFVPAGMAQGAGSKTVNINVQAPTAQGTYYILLAFRAEIDAGDVFSMTNWARSGGEVWNDGNDIADFSATKINTANANGNVVASVLFDSGYQNLYIPATAVRVEVVAQSSDPGATSSLRLLSGTVNGKNINAQDRTITVSPGEAISGTITTEYISSFGSNAVMVYAGTRNWGDHASGCVGHGSVNTPASGTKTHAVNFVAPTTPGTYWITYAFRGEFTNDQICSMTNWASSTGTVYNDGNDIADWNENMIQTANANGRVVGKILLAPNDYRDFYVPATALRIVVEPEQPPAANDPGATSNLLLKDSTLNGAAITPQNRVLSVTPGQRITGTVNLQYTSSWTSDATLPFGYTPSWGNHQTSFRSGGTLSTPVNSAGRSMNVDVTAPTAPGTYWITFAYRAEVDHGDVFSMTNWARSGGELWNDFNDIAGWSTTMINTANANGRVLGQVLFNEGYLDRSVPATSIRIDVQQAPSGGNCATSVSQLSVECKGGSKTSDTLSGSCRTVTCSGGSSAITGQACDKPGFFEIYQKSKTGSGVDVCFGGTCLAGWGYRRGGNYPVCESGSTPPPTGSVCGNGMIQSGEQCDDGNTASGDGCSSTCQTETVSGTSVDLRIKQWYPQGRNYIFVCDETGYTATSYLWNFGDGHKQTTTSEDVYHTYANAGPYTAQCTASGGGVSKSDTLQITVN